MRAQPCHAAAKIGDPPLRSQRAKPLEQRASGLHRPGGRPICEGQVGRRAAPGGAIQCQPGQIGIEDFRLVMRRQAAMQRLGPEPDRYTWRLTPGASGTLCGAGAADAQSCQPAQPGALVQHWRAAEPTIDDNAHAGHGQRGLGNRGRQHNPPPSGNIQRPVLLGRRQIAMQRQHQRAASVKLGLGTADFAHSG